MSTEITIDESWHMEIGSSITLIEKVKTDNPKAKNEFSYISRGYYGHVDEALKSYLRKSINPKSSISDIVELIEKNVANLKARKVIK